MLIKFLLCTYIIAVSSPFTVSFYLRFFFSDEAECLPALSKVEVSKESVSKKACVNPWLKYFVFLCLFVSNN